MSDVVETAPAGSLEPIPGRCGARTRAGRYCTNRPLTGGTRCRMHGGATPAAKAAAKRRQQQAELERAVVTYGLPVEIDPVEALLGELARTQGAVLWLEQQVRGLEAAAVVWSDLEELEGREETEGGEWGTGTKTTTATKRGAAPHALVVLYGQERDRLTRVAEACRKAGVEQAVQDRMRAAAVEFLDQLERIVAALGHNPNDPAVLRVIAGVLRGAPTPRLEVTA